MRHCTTKVLRRPGLAPFWKSDFGSQKLISIIIKGYQKLNKGKMRMCYPFRTEQSSCLKKKLCPLREIVQYKVPNNLNARRGSCLHLYRALDQIYQLPVQLQAPKTMNRATEIANTFYLTVKFQNDPDD
jgi:hypothetical protein